MHAFHMRNDGSYVGLTCNESCTEEILNDVAFIIDDSVDVFGIPRTLCSCDCVSAGIDSDTKRL